MLDMTRYPCHDPALATSHLDQVYARQMEDFDLDYDLDQEDERCGRLCLSPNIRIVSAPM